MHPAGVPVVLVADSRDPLAEFTRLAESWRELRGAVVHARVPVERLGRIAFFATLGGARAVIAAPIGRAHPLPWWERRFHRFVVDSQADARAWSDVGIAMGRIAVAPPGRWQADALRAIWLEVASMATRH